jgi:uncharacterized membrane protein
VTAPLSLPEEGDFAIGRFYASLEWKKGARMHVLSARVWTTLANASVERSAFVRTVPLDRRSYIHVL